MTIAAYAHRYALIVIAESNALKAYPRTSHENITFAYFSHKDVRQMATQVPAASLLFGYRHVYRISAVSLSMNVCN